MHRGPDRRSLAAGLAIAVALLAAGGGQSAQPPVAARGRRRGVARFRRRRPGRDRGRPADDRRAQEPVARRPARRGGGHGDRVGDAPVDGRGAGRAEADRGAALARGDPARAGLRLHAHVQRLLGADRRTRAGVARAGRGRLRRLPGACGVPGRPFGGGAARRRVRRRKPAGAPRSGSRASTAAGSRSRSSTPASTSRIRSSATGCSTGSTCSIPSGAGSRVRTPTSRRGSSGTARSWPG